MTETVKNRVIVTTTTTAVVLVIDCDYAPLLEVPVEIEFSPKLALSLAGNILTAVNTVTTGSGEQLELYLL